MKCCYWWLLRVLKQSEDIPRYGNTVNNSFSATVCSNMFKDFTTTVYLKPTFSGVYSNFKNFIANEYKHGLIFTLLFQSFSIVFS